MSEGTELVVTGWSAVTAAGVGPAALREALWTGAGADLNRDVTGRWDQPLPEAAAPVLVDFDVKAHLSRKGTSFYDRCTSLAVVACGAALTAGSVPDDTLPADRIGLVLGTTVGSFQSVSDYSRDTLVQEKPYLVNAVLFPNTVMNCAAGQAAIRYGLQGVNATIAGGALAFHHALGYAANALHRGHADAVLVGAVEEFSPHRAWYAARARARQAVSGEIGPAGEGAAVFLLERADAPRRPGTTAAAAILGVASGFGEGAHASDALAGCVRRVLAEGGVTGGEVGLVLTGEASDGDRSEYDPVAAALGCHPERYAVSGVLGECDAATGALAMGALLTRVSGGPPIAAGPLVLLTARTPDGGVSAALVRVAK